MESDVVLTRRPWNKGILVGQKRPLQPKNVWSIRVRLEMSSATRELALFNLAIDSKLRACDLVRLRVDDLWSGSSVRDRATIIQKKTKRPVQFEVTEQTKLALTAWLPSVKRTGGSYLFPGGRRQSAHLSTRQYARIVHRWVRSIGLEASAYGTHSMRRTKAALIYKKTGNLRAVQILLGHTKLEAPSDISALKSTTRCGSRSRSSSEMTTIGGGRWSPARQQRS
jgi:integrase